MLRLSAENSGEKPIFQHEINGHRIALRMDGLCVLELGSIEKLEFVMKFILVLLRNTCYAVTRRW